MKKIAFVCVHNSCRSQIAEAFARIILAKKYEVFSAGTQLKPQINQQAVRLMKDNYGIDMEIKQRSKLMSDIPEANYYIKMGCNVVCPIVPINKMQDWGIDDPTDKSDLEFLETIEIIRQKIIELLLT